MYFIHTQKIQFSFLETRIIPTSLSSSGKKNLCPPWPPLYKIVGGYIPPVAPPMYGRLWIYLSKQFKHFLTTKPFIGHHTFCSNNTLKITYSKVEFQKCSRGKPPDSHLKGRGRWTPATKIPGSAPVHTNVERLHLSSSWQHLPSDWLVICDLGKHLCVMSMRVMWHGNIVLDIIGTCCELRRSSDGTLQHATHQLDRHGWYSCLMHLCPDSQVWMESVLFCLMACTTPL